MPRLYEEDDTADPLGPLARLMNERLAKVEKELDAYADRRVGVGKAFAFMARLEAEIAEANIADGERARTAYDQEVLLNEQRQVRKAAEARARELEVEVTALRGKVQALQKRIFVLEKQHDLEMLGYVEGFKGVGEYVGAAEERVLGLVAALAQRLTDINARVVDRHTRREELLAAQAAEAEKVLFLSPEEYSQTEPLSQKGIKSYLILHDALLQAQRTLATRTHELEQAKIDHITQLSRVQRRLREATEENAALRGQLQQLLKP